MNMSLYKRYVSRYYAKVVVHLRLTFGIRTFIQVSLLFLVATSHTFCKKFIEVDPPTNSLNAGNVYTNDASAVSVVTDIYAEMSEQNHELRGEDLTSITLYGGLAADELTLYDLNNQNLLLYYRNDLTRFGGHFYWNSIYQRLFAVNNAIEGLQLSSNLAQGVVKQLLGELKFMRGFLFFYLVNIYGDVPLVLSTDWIQNAQLSKSSKDQVYKQIITDLTDAQNILSDKYLTGDAVTPYPESAVERVRPTKWAAMALLSRIHLFVGDWKASENLATAVINNTSLYAMEMIDNVFKKNNKEAIWQLQPVGANNTANTGEGKLFNLPSTGPNNGENPVYLSSTLVNAFEPEDSRKLNWVGYVVTDNSTYYYSNKYKVGTEPSPTTEYSTVIRLAEIFLNRAEARVRQNNINGALEDLNVIRQRANLPLLNESDMSLLMHAIWQERQMELFTEWGHRWFDLKRTNTIDAILEVITAQKGGTWNSYKSLWPIPQSDIEKNTNLSQNLGY